MPVTTRIILAGIALATLVAWVAFGRRRRRREGWSFTGRVPTISQPHKDRLRDLCGAGVLWAEIKNNDKLKYFAKYDEQAALAECKIGRATLKSGYGTDIGLEAANQKCQAIGRKGCTKKTLRSSNRLCMTHTGDKCCEIKGDGVTNCRPIDDGKDEFNFDVKNPAPANQAGTPQAAPAPVPYGVGADYKGGWLTEPF